MTESGAAWNRSAAWNRKEAIHDVNVIHDVFPNISFNILNYWFNPFW